MQTLSIIYDDRCALSRWLKDWAEDRPAFVALVFVRAGSAEAERVAPGLSGNSVVVADLIAVGDGGEVYRGDSAWVMCFYAVEEFREWSIRMATPELLPLARKAFVVLSRHRVRVADWLAMTDREAIAAFGRVAATEPRIAASGLRTIHEMVAGPEPRDTRPGR